MVNKKLIDHLRHVHHTRMLNTGELHSPVILDSTPASTQMDPTPIPNPGGVFKSMVGVFNTCGMWALCFIFARTLAFVRVGIMWELPNRLEVMWLTDLNNKRTCFHVFRPRVACNNYPSNESVHDISS